MLLPRGLALVLVSVLLTNERGAAQTPNKPIPDLSAAATKAVALAEQSHCDVALPRLEKSLRIADPELKRKVGLAGVRCAMTTGHFDSALHFLEMLVHDFPHDPEVLYSEIHAFSDLSTQASQMLARSAPSSPEARELLAESYEMQGKWVEAEKEYRAIAAENPKLPGIHFRIGRLLLSRPNPPAGAADEARREFIEELTVDPTNAGAEYVLGEMARQDGQWKDAIQHFTRATELDAGFADAFLGLGNSLMSTKRFTEAIPPLQTAVKLESRNPAAHYSLATALIRTGRKDEAEKEFAIHRQMTQKGNADQGNQAGTEQNPN